MSGARHPRPASRRQGTVVLVAAAGAAAVLAGYLRLPVRMQAVQVSGLTRMSREEVVRMVGVEPGTLVGAADARRIEQNLARRPAFASVAVGRGMTGILHVRVAERRPVAWSLASGCAVAADGVLLPHLAAREADWIGLEGLPEARGRVTGPGAVGEALAIHAGLVAAGITTPGTLRWLGSGGWDWQAQGRHLTFSSPPNPDEVARLVRFQRTFPDAWARARRLDLRYAERVVVASGSLPPSAGRGAASRPQGGAR